MSLRVLMVEGPDDVNALRAVVDAEFEADQ